MEQKDLERNSQFVKMDIQDSAKIKELMTFSEKVTDYLRKKFSKEYTSREDSGFSLEIEFKPVNEKIAFINFYHNKKSIFQGTLSADKTGISMDLSNGLGHDLINYKLAILAISDISALSGISKLEITITDSYCSAPRAKALTPTFESVGLKYYHDTCSWTHLTIFNNSEVPKQLPYHGHNFSIDRILLLQESKV